MRAQKSMMHFSILILGIGAAVTAAMPSPNSHFAKREVESPWIILYTDDSAQYGEVCHFDFPHTAYNAQLHVTPGICRTFLWSSPLGVHTLTVPSCVDQFETDLGCQKITRHHSQIHQVLSSWPTTSASYIFRIFPTRLTSVGFTSKLVEPG